MAQKYLDTSLASGLNDGTSLANAWQSLSQVMTNTMPGGSYAAGDTINIRSHDGAANITANLGAGAITQASIGTDASPVTWLIDDGTVWASGGIFTLEHGGDTVLCKFSKNSKWIAKAALSFVVRATNTSHKRNFNFVGSSYWENVEFNAVVPGAASKVHMMVFGDGSSAADSLELIFKDCKFKLENTNTGADSFPFIGIYQYGTEATFLNCEFDLANMTNLQNVFNGISAITGGVTSSMRVSGSIIRFRGGKITNGTTAHVFFKYYQQAVGNHNYSWTFDAIGLDFGLVSDKLVLGGADSTVSNLNNARYQSQGSSGKQSMLVEHFNGTTLWDPLGNFPVLSATIPDNANTNFSLQVYPKKCYPSHPFMLLPLNKYFNIQTAAVRTVTAELAIKDTNGVGGSGAFDNPQKDEWYMRVTYVDNATGQYVSEDTITTGALTTSLAAWVPLSGLKVIYGGNNYSRYKLELTTANSVKSDTMMFIEVFTTKPAIFIDDFYFIDPDPAVV